MCIADASEKRYMPMLVSEWYQCFFLGQILSFFEQFFWENHGFYFLLKILICFSILKKNIYPILNIKK